MLIFLKTSCSQQLELESWLTGVVFIIFSILMMFLILRNCWLDTLKQIDAIQKFDLYWGKCILSDLVLELGTSGSVVKSPEHPQLWVHRINLHAARSGKCFLQPSVSPVFVISGNTWMYLLESVSHSSWATQSTAAGGHSINAVSASCCLKLISRYQDWSLLCLLKHVDKGNLKSKYRPGR